MSRLEMETLEEFCRLFKDKEESYVVMVGQVNTVNENVTTMTVVASLKFNGFGDNDLVMVGETVGSAIIPPEQWKESPELQSVFMARKAEFESLRKKTLDLKRVWKEKLISCGFDVMDGVWFI